MKVLFVDNPFAHPTDGGGYTFQQLLLSGLKRMHSRHVCSYVQPEPYKGVVQALVHQNQIDFVWFTSVYCEPVGVPFATTVWDLGHREMPWFPELSLSGWTFEQREQHYRDVLPRASIIAIGNAAGAHAIREFYRIPAGRIFEIALPVDAEALRAQPSDPGALQGLGLTPDGYLLYPAQFWPHKNHVTLIDMLSLLHATGRRLKLVLTGGDKGNRGYIEEYVRQRGLQDSVVFTGFIESALLNQLYRHAFALTYASLLGPDNLPPLEGMALDCPVVCAAFDGAREQLGDAALLFDPLDAAAAAARVAQLEDPQWRQRLCERGRNIVASRSPAEYTRRINEALDGFAARRKLWGPSDGYLTRAALLGNPTPAGHAPKKPANGQNRSVRKIKLETPNGSVVADLPPPGDFDSFYVFALHKSGSTLMNNMLMRVFEAAEIAQITIPDLVFMAGLPNEILNAEDVYFERGYCYRGYRAFPEYLHKFDLSAKKKVLLIRDPRDMVVSNYFSAAKSHVIPETGPVRELFLAKRQEASSTDIDDFCLVNIDQFIDEFRSYEHLLGTDIRIYRYEDVVFNKAAWLRDMLSYFGVAADPAAVSHAAREFDVIPSEERPDQHIRQVHPGNFRKHLRKETIVKLNERLKPILEKHNYSMN